MPETGQTDTGARVPLGPRGNDGQHDTRHQQGTDGNDQQRLGRVRQREPEHGARVPYVESRKPADGRRIHIPRRSRHVKHVVQRCRVRGMKAVIHGRRQPKRDKHPSATLRCESGIAQEFREGVGQALGLHQQPIGNRTHRHDLSIAWRNEVSVARIDVSRAGLQATREARTHGWKPRVRSLFEMQVACQPRQHANQQRGRDRMFPAGQACHQWSHQWRRQAVADNETQSVGDWTLTWRPW